MTRQISKERRQEIICEFATRHNQGYPRRAVGKA
jgi:hypothetical protein